MMSAAADKTRIDPRVIRTREDVITATLALLIDGGWDAVTQANVAKKAGYSRATVYAQWPNRADLLRDAFARYGEMPHHPMTGDLRADLIGELFSFRAYYLEHRLDRAMSVLVERASVSQEFAAIRNVFVADGERNLRELLKNALGKPKTAKQIARHEAALASLAGAVTHTVLLQGRAPTDETIAAVVDIVIRGLDLEGTTGQGIHPSAQNTFRKP
jgi:AcrR family transcriptional regulator